MTKATQAGVSRRGLLVGGAVLGLGMVIGRGALAQTAFRSLTRIKPRLLLLCDSGSISETRGSGTFGEFQATNANFDNTRQLEQWQSLLLSRPSAIISDPIDSQAIVSAIRRYNREKIPVGIIDTPQTVGMWRLPSASIIFKVASWRRKRSLTA